ncbi:RdgB/HAM1 family non-canonical purine NTP pyrophosphatase [Motiliproteus sp. SC1-56]|uniref:RdgB/HAM1 family non-canonical purine NTP pyrophosphatase n=1 Tax=Motiliproteus sp. SC1-56 TaxID=2799565 RepID=UPI001A8F7AD8|nr:RdgB/HAM1 family non-canonical purine NTP pyrophosphatase [Motiliproteus sp. SC1-56]
MQKIVLASGNRGKLKEFNQVLGPLEWEVLPQVELGVADIEEHGLSFVENALIKARHASRCTGLAALADDSGLEVDVLKGAPGIYSARYAGPGATDADNNAKLLEALEGVPEEQRTARFQCLLVFLRHAEDPTPLICQGTWEGRIALAPKGANGFGYDPLFYVPEHRCHSAELDPAQKHRLSHRGQAVAELVRRLQARQV